MTFHVATSKALKIYWLSYYHVNADENLVLNQTARLIRFQFLLVFVIFTPFVIKTWKGSFQSGVMKFAEVKSNSIEDKRDFLNSFDKENQNKEDLPLDQYYSTDDKRDIFNTFDTEKQNDLGLPLDPFDLMNRLKQAGAMNDATTPSHALDEALNAFDDSTYSNVPIK